MQKYIKLIFAIVIALCLIFLVAGSAFGAGSGKAKDEIDGYTKIKDVPGVSFFINSSFADAARAVTEVSDNVDLRPDEFYSYRDGEGKYVLFNMEKIIVIAQKGTAFHIGDSNDKEEALTGESLMNVWFTKAGKKLESETDRNVTKTQACAAVVINADLYGDFVGQLVNITDGSTEWSLFVGIPGEIYENLSSSAKKGISAITETFTFNDSVPSDTSVYAVTVEGDGTDKEPVKTQKEETEGDSIAFTETITDRDELKAYTSSPYNMLSLGDNGLLDAFNDDLKDYEEPIICVSKVYRGKDAADIIKATCSGYSYTEPSFGTSWEVAEYSLNYKNCTGKPYVDIRFCGMDGKQLRYRGVKYASHTYDLTKAATEDGGWIKHLFVYYEVPNGCTEYCIKAGGNRDGTGAAYYRIQNSENKMDERIRENEGTNEISWK